jgi:hypothetical protein
MNTSLSFGESDDGEYVPERQNVVPALCELIAPWMSPPDGMSIPEQLVCVGEGSLGVGEDEGPEESEPEGSGVGDAEDGEDDVGLGVDDVDVVGVVDGEVDGVDPVDPDDPDDSVLLEVTVSLTDLVFPDVSVARAVSVCEPLARLVVSTDLLQLEVPVTSAKDPASMDSSTF